MDNIKQKLENVHREEHIAKLDAHLKNKAELKNKIGPGMYPTHSHNTVSKP